MRQNINRKGPDHTEKQTFGSTQEKGWQRQATTTGVMGKGGSSGGKKKVERYLRLHAKQEKKSHGHVLQNNRGGFPTR